MSAAKQCLGKILLGVVVLVSLIDITEQFGLIGSPKALYEPTDHVVILNATNIKPTIYGTKHGWLVEFFSSWCGHCIHFAPIYKQFAAEVEGWQSVVKIAGIDCADENNIPICREYEIMGYPTMLFFPPNSKETKITQDDKSELYRGEQFPRSDKVSQLKHDLMEIVTPHFPQVLGEFTGDALSFPRVWTYVKSTSPYGIPTPILVVILYESEKSFLGKELALRLSSFPEIRVVRFQKRNSLYGLLGFKDEWPAVAYLKPDNKRGVIDIPKNKDIAVFLQSTVLKMAKLERAPSERPVQVAQIDGIIDSVDTKNDAGDADNQPENDGKEQHNILEEPASSTSQDTVSLEDLIHAIRNSLRNEVGVLKTVSGSKLKVLKEYVHVLGQLFPADRRELIVFLMKLDKWLETQAEEIQVNDYMDKLTELELELHPWDINVKSWGACEGTVPGRRGYTCSLWRLFHTLTVIATQKSQEIFVLPIIHGYVKEFFGCSECVKHFTKMVADEGALMISTVRDQALWLWRAHNKVNIRLKGSASEDPGYPKAEYPSETQCPICRTSEGPFDEEKVFEYLVNVYTNPIRTMQSHHEEKSGDPQPHLLTGENQSRTSRFFSGTDYWIFCIVYLSVAALLIFGYMHFKLGSRRRVDPLAICRKFIHTSRSIV